MTVKEAFAQAFDETFVMDAAPSGLSPNAGKAGGSNAAKAKGMGSGMSAAAKGADRSMGPQKSLAEHKKEGCDAEKNGHPERCPYVQRMTKDFEKQGMSHEEAQKKALQEHGAAATANVGIQKTGEVAESHKEAEMPQQIQNQETLQQQAQQIAQNPQMMEQIPSEMLPETKMVKTEAGELPAQTTVQEGILENLTEQAASGNTLAEESLQDLKDKVEDGTITQKEDYDADDNELALASEERAKEKHWSRAESEAQGTLYLDKNKNKKIQNTAQGEYEAAQAEYAEASKRYGDAVLREQSANGQAEKDAALKEVHESWAAMKAAEEAVNKSKEASRQNVPEPAQTITTSDGKSSREIEADEAMVLAANPEKNEIFQKMVDLEGMVGDLKEDSPEFKDLANQYQALQRMFFGDEGGEETSLKGSQKRMFERVKKEFPGLDEKTFLENKELFDELSKLDSQIARIPNSVGGKAGGIRKTLQNRREEIKQAIMNKQRFILPDAPSDSATPSGKPREESPSDNVKPQEQKQSEQPSPEPKPQGEKPHQGDAGGPRKAGRKADYLDALDKMIEAREAYWAVRAEMRKDPGGTEEKYKEKLDAAKKSWEDAYKEVKAFEQADVDIVDDDGNPIDTGADRRQWAEQERLNRRNESVGGSSPPNPPDGGDDGDGTPPKLCPICSTPLKKDGTCPKQNEPWHKEGKSGPDDDNGGNGGGGGGGDETSSPPHNNTTPTNPSEEKSVSGTLFSDALSPDDSKYRIGENKYKVNGVVYTDVSGKGLLRTMISAFMAGLRGEEIITGWDRISGAWDQIKRSASGENVRSGITQALSNIGLAEFASKVTDPTAKGELEVIQEMFEKAKTPAQKMAAYNAFDRWKKKYIKEEEDSTNKENSLPAKIAKSEKEIHSDGKVLGPNQRIDNEGKIVEDKDNVSEPPSTDVLGEPGFVNPDGSVSWNPKAEIKDLEAKKSTISEAMDMVGIVGDEADSTTSFNSTFVRYNLPMLITDKQKTNLAKQIAFSLGMDESEVSVAVDAKNKQLVVGIKNDVSADLATRDIMNSDAWKQACKKMRCPIILGRDEQGNPVIKDMKELTHLLIAGDTGKGKSVGMNTILCSMMMAKPPSKLKTVLIDLKKVELSSFEDSKHNAVPVATDIESALESLNFVKQEMENREALLKKAKVKNIDEYNEWAKKNGKPELPSMVLGIDELTELKEAGGSKVYELLKTIGNKGRASGIHLLCATQKPTKENIGEVKSAFTSRLAFPIKATEGSEAIFSKGDYRATKLAGKGSFILDLDGKEIRGKGSAMGNDDPRRIVGYWNGEKPTEGSYGSGSGEEQKLPQEHLEAISDAVEKGNPISIVAEEGFLDAFKNAFPSDWAITEVEVDGEKHWKASPPSARGESSQGKGQSGLPTITLKGKYANTNTPVQHTLDNGDMEIPLATYAADKGYEWQGKPNGLDVNALDAIASVAGEAATEANGEFTERYVIQVNIGNGKVAIVSKVKTGTGFDAVGRSAELMRVAFVDEATAKANGKKIAEQLQKMAVPAKGSDPSLKETVFTFSPTTAKPTGETGDEGDRGESVNNGTSSGGEGDKPSSETKEKENTDWRKESTREDAVATLSKVRDAAKAKAWDAYNQGDDTVEAQKKLQKALEKADADFNTKMNLVDMKFPPPEDDHMDKETEEEGEEDASSSEGNEDDDEDSTSATMKDIEESFNAELERIEKSLAKPTTKVRDKQKLREARKELKKRFNEAKAKFDDGGSSEDLLNIYEPEETSTETGGTEEKESTGEQHGEGNTESGQQEQVKNDEDLKATVRDQKFYNTPGFKATSKITPKQIKQMENLLPAGWEFVTDNQFKAPARTKNGVVFIRHPTNGSYGRIFIKTDEKGKEYIEPEAQIDVDTTHPDYQGFVKNEDGTYSLTEEGKKAEAEYKHIRKYSKNEKEREEAQKKFNRIRFGHDEAPDNMTIVANAVADVLGKLE